LGTGRRECPQRRPHSGDRFLEGAPAFALLLRWATPRPAPASSTASAISSAAAADMAFPLLVKANIGGSGAGITRYASLAELEQSVGRRHRPRQRGQGAAAPGLRARPRRHDHPHRDTGRPLPLRAGGGEPPRQLRSLPRRRVPGPARPRRHCHARRDPAAPHHRGRRAESRRPPSSTSAGSSW
jgi:hypothetical protein